MKQSLHMRHYLIILAAISLIATIGGALYEHIAVIPTWSAAPPASLSMFQGKYGLNSAPFWQSIHPVTLVLFIAALVTNWKTAARKNILIAFGAWAVVMIVTAVYFVPELLSIVQSPYSDTVSPELQRRASLWETLSLIRMVLMLGFAIVLQAGLVKAGAER